MIPEIRSALPSQKWLQILNDSDLRNQIITRKTGVKNYMQLTQRELQCLSLIKIWIEALLHFTNSDAKHWQVFLDVSVEILIEVLNGSVYHSQDRAERLGALFLVAFAD